ncbi:MAG: sulfatase [Planctomycetes bacterium]|nr:sulfatase [Planctomycetota bacterium]
MSSNESSQPLAGAIGSGLTRAAAWGALFGALETAGRLTYYTWLLEEGRLTVPPTGLVDAIVCVVLSACTMAVVGLGLGVVGLLVLSPVLALVARSRDAAWRARFAPVVAVVGGALFLQLYWYSRFFVDFAYSEPWSSPKRLALGGVLALAAGVVGMFAANRLERRGSSNSRAALAGLIVLALVSAGLSWREDAKDDVAARRGVDHNVVLFIIDTLRADHLACYGYPRPTSPRIDELARDGVLFERAIAQAPYTWTSFGSIFTGKYPRAHGLLKMDATQRFDPKRNVTIQQVLDAAGHRTGAFMTGMISNASGLLDGFATYFESTVGRDPVRRASLWSYWRSELVAHALWNKLRRALDPAIVSNEAIAWLDDHANDRFFLVVHLFSTHTPYDPPRAYDVFETSGASDLDRFTTDHARAIEMGQWTPTDGDKARITDLYDGGVLFADAQVGSVVDELARLGVLDETAIVITADHGEAFGENGPFWEHDWMFNTNQHVPLIVRLPGKAGAGTRVPVPVETVDIAPTLVDLLQLPPMADVHGESLMPWARGERPKTDDFAYCENNYYESIQNAEWKLVRPRAPDPKDPPRLYHLASDPGERRNVAKSKPEALAAMTAALDAWVKSLPEWRIDRGGPASAEIGDLASQLGYVGDRPHEGSNVIDEDASKQDAEKKSQ